MVGLVIGVEEKGWGVATIVLLCVTVAIVIVTFRYAVLGRTSVKNSGYLPFVVCVLLGGSFMVVCRMASGLGEPSWYLLAFSTFQVAGGIGALSTYTPNWRSNAIDDFQLVLSLTTVALIGLGIFAPQHTPDYLPIDVVCLVGHIATNMLVWRMGRMRLHGCPRLLLILALFLTCVIACYAIVMAAGIWQSPLLMLIAQVVGFCGGVLMVIYMAYRASKKQFDQHAAPPRPRHGLVRNILALAALAGYLGAILADALEPTRLVMCCIVALFGLMLSRELITLMEFRNLKVYCSSQRRHYRMIISQSGDAIGQCHPDTFQVVDLSPACEELLGVTPRQATGMLLHQLINTDYDQLADLRDNAVVADGRGTIETRRLWRHLETTITKQREYLRVTITDVSQRAMVREELCMLAHIDKVTGLSNRHDILTGLARMVENSRSPVHVLFVDLDHFKNINDTAGHLAGDRALKLAAQRMQATVGATGQLGRLGGDEFLIIFPGTADDALRLAHDVTAAVSQPMEIGGRRFSVGASIGISGRQLSNVGARDHDELVRQADTAMYSAKRSGAGVRFFDSSMDQHSVMWTASQLPDSARDDVADAHYQLQVEPIVSTGSKQLATAAVNLVCGADTGRATSAGPLWDHADRHERTVAAGRIIIRQTVEALASLPPQASLQVPLRHATLYDPRTVSFLGKLCQHYGVARRRVVLTVREYEPFLDVKQTARAMSALHAAGHHLWLVGFGSEYSSFRSIYDLPVTGISIGRNMVQLAMRREPSCAIIAELATYTRENAMVLAASGVQTHAEYRMMKRLGVVLAQGKYCGRPTPVTEFISENADVMWHRKPTLGSIIQHPCRT